MLCKGKKGLHNYKTTTETRRCGWCMLLISQNLNTQRFNLHLLQIFFEGLASSTSRAARQGKKQKQADSDSRGMKALVHMVLVTVYYVKMITAVYCCSYHRSIGLCIPGCDLQSTKIMCLCIHV